jgi:iduronate 2-sulfatase
MRYEKKPLAQRIDLCFLCLPIMKNALHFCCLLPLWLMLTTAQAAPRPNVLLICVDDLKPTLGCYGDKAAKSPHIDALAQRGLRFDYAYCNQAVCAPSRNALLTSLRPQTTGIYDLATHFRKVTPAAVTLPQCFKNQGYQTEAIGKIFHVGHGNINDEASWSAPHRSPKIISYALEANQVSGGSREEALFENRMAGAAKLPRGAATESADVADEAYGDGEIADVAAKRLAELAQKPEQPFFLAVGFLKPHLPFVAPKKYWDLYDPAQLPQPQSDQPPKDVPAYAPTTWGELRQYRDMPEQGPVDAVTQRQLIHGYYAAMSYMDAQLGKVISALKANHLDENTLIVLWGDHGYHLGDHGMWCKHSNYEQATRIPVLLIAPGQVPAASHSDALLETVDLYPTLVELAGLKPEPGLDGISYATHVKAPGTAPAPRDHTVQVYPRPPHHLGRALRTQRYRLVEWQPLKDGASVEYELYDYETDPAESANLASQLPQVLNELKTKLASHPQPKASDPK